VTYAFDTFFAISGLLVTYVHLKYSEKIRISLSLFYTYRILRLKH
jgi:peptidoglycan/LPS O-acetylase OafA/YrhL